MNSHSKSPLLRLPSDLLQDWSLPSVGQPPICADLSTTKSRSRELFKLPTPELRPYFRARAVVPWRPPCTRRHPASSRSLFQPVSPRSRRLVCQWSGCRDSPANLLGRHTQLIAGAGPRQPCCRHAAAPTPRGKRTVPARGQQPATTHSFAGCQPAVRASPSSGSSRRSRRRAAARSSPGRLYLVTADRAAGTSRPRH